MKAGDTVGPWTLRRHLGSGGNADVWEAERGDEVVALKVLRTRNPDSEPFKRFKIETDVVTGWRPHGVVPIIDSYLPDRTEPGERPWVAMPVAARIDEVLGERPDLETVCEAMWQIARTLAALGILAHRDIKPGNLYLLDGRFLIGDFGLVSYPGKEDLTGSAHELGPRNFLAPEMIAAPADADGRPADVYSLAKTLWALAVGRPAPPPGQFRRDDPPLRLGTYAKHPRVAQLEELLEEATRMDPAARPSMASFRDALRRFLDGRPAGPSDVGEAAARVRGAIAGIEGRIKAETDPANKLVLYELGEALAPIVDALRRAGLEGSKIGHSEDILYFGGRQLSLEREGREQAWTGGRATETTIKAFDNFPAFRMLSGIAIEVARDEQAAVMVAAHSRNLGTASEEDEREIDGRHYWVGERRFRLLDRNSVVRALEELSSELLENLRPALEAFAEDIEHWRHNPKTARRYGY